MLMGCVRILLFVFCIGSWAEVFAQKDERIKKVELYLLDMAQDMALDGDNLNSSMALEYFEELLEHPININRATRDDLERLLFFSDFQIQSLLTYRAEHGDILSGAELSLLNGFNEEMVDILKCFFVFDYMDGGMGRKSSGNFFKDCYSTLLLKGNRVLERQKWYMPITEEELNKNPNSRYLGTPYYTQLKYKCEYLNHVQVGFTLENDSGERVFSKTKLPMGDFFSFHTAFKDVKIGREGEKNKGILITNFILGDFSARFGQGLTLWNSFALMGISNPQGLYKKGAAILPYTSSDENNFFRGAAISCRKEFSYSGGKGLNDLEIAAIFSYNSVDAAVNDNIYTSIIAGGLHNTQSTYNTKNAMNEMVAGVNAIMRFRRLKIGFSWASYGYNRENGRRVEEYNKYQMYNGSWGNVSADFYAIIKRYRFFGEIAFDYGGSFAALAGSLFNIGSCEIGVLARSYSKSYIAPHANAYTTITSCSNQNGVAVNMAYSISKVLKISSSIDFAHYPWIRFNIPTESAILKLILKMDYKGERFSGYIRLANSYSTHESFNKIGLRALCDWRLSKNINVRLRNEVATAGKRELLNDKLDNKELQKIRSSNVGYATAVDIDYRLQNGKFRIQMRGAYFYTPDWDTRMYMYEADLPNSFNSQLLYGKGFRGYLLIEGRPFGRIDLYIKLDTIRYGKRGEDNEIPAPLSKIKLGLKVRF